MRSIKFDMWVADRLVTLKDVLTALPKNTWNWTILYFEGVGTAPGDVPMSEFEERARQSKSGIWFSWEELEQFAEKQNQTINCLIAGLSESTSALDAQAIRNEDYRTARCVIEGFDSTHWTVVLNDDSISLEQLLALQKPPAQASPDPVTHTLRRGPVRPLKNAE